MKFSSIYSVFFNAYFWLFIVMALGLYLRLYKIDSPIADWHSWRQADTASVTRNFIKEGFNPFLPKFDDMSGLAKNPIINTGRFRFVEFPLYNIFVYPFYVFFGVNEIYHRLVSVIFSLGSIVLIFLIAKRYVDVFNGLIASFIYALLPFNVFFSRTTLPEPTFVFFALGMLYFVDRWIYENGRKLFLVGLVFSICAFLIKPWALFFALPLITAYLSKEGKFFPIKKRYIIFTILSLFPFFLWRLWIMQHPEGTPDFTWLTNGDGIRFRPAFWWWLVSERIGGEILGVTGAILLTIGIIIKPKKGNYFLHFFLLSIFAYFIVFATGNIRHNYYQYLFVPIASIFVALGFMHLIRSINDFIPRIWTIFLALLLFPLMFYFSWKVVSGFYQINNPVIVEAGIVADKILPKDALVIAPYGGDTAFLYQTNRVGWPKTPLPIQEMVSYYGATHYVSTARDAKTAWVVKYFEVLVDNPSFVIADLKHLKQPLDPEDPEP